MIWSEKGYAMMAYKRPGNGGLISIKKFPTLAARSKFILSLGNKEIDPQVGDPRVIRARLLGLFNQRRQGETSPLRLVNAEEEQRTGPIVVVLWCCVGGPEERLTFMLATGTSAGGLQETKQFISDAQRRAHLRLIPGTHRLLNITRLRKIPASDLDRLIRSRGDQSSSKPSAAAVIAGMSGEQPRPLPQPLRPGKARQDGSTTRLTGKSLLDKVRELDGCRKSEIVRQCGYGQRRSDGRLRLNYTAYFEALVQAKQVDAKARAREGKRESKPPSIVIDNPAGLKADDLLRLPAGRRLNPDAQARRQALAEVLRQQEEKQAQRLKKREERRRLLGLDEPEAPEDMMRIAIRAGAPGQGKR